MLNQKKTNVNENETKKEKHKIKTDLITSTFLLFV